MNDNLLPHIINGLLLNNLCIVSHCRCAHTKTGCVERPDANTAGFAANGRPLFVANIHYVFGSVLTNE